MRRVKGSSPFRLILSGSLKNNQNRFSGVLSMSRHFSFAGMQRSGNHAIINWWLNHFGGWHFRNNILGKTHRCRAAQIETFGVGTVLNHCDSWENYDPTTIKISRASEPLVVILRDPYNWFASWFNYGIPNPNSKGVPRIDTIKWYLKYVEYAKANVKQVIIYNRWFSSFEYRRGIESRFDMMGSDVGLNNVSEIGNQGSFDGGGFHGRAQEMAVLTRFERVMAFPAYRQPLQAYPELADISRELFDLEPPVGLHT